MSCWTDLWREFIRETSYVHILKEHRLSNDEFWRSYEIYDQVLKLSGYPGEILAKISSFIPPGSTLLDIGAGTGSFAVPLSRKTSRTVAVDPSQYQLQILMEKAKKEGLTNIIPLQKEWKDVKFAEICELNNLLSDSPGFDYTLAAYSMFDENIENFLSKMIDVSRKGIFIVFRADSPDPLNEFASGPKPKADYICLREILKDMGYNFHEMQFSRDYSIPLELVFKIYRFSWRSREEIAEHLRSTGRIQRRQDGEWAAFSARDALLYSLI